MSVFRKACYFENSRGYVGSKQVRELIDRIIALIECADRNSIKHRTLKEARSYLSGAKSDIVAYKFAIENAVESHFGSANLDMVLGHVCPIIECLDQIQRSYENRKRKAYWTEKLVQLRQRFRQFDFIDQTEVDNAINSVATIMRRFKKSNSLIEAVNSVIRRHLVTHKSIPSWFCPIFTFYWNHKTFPRGKRAGLKPQEIVTGEHFEMSWIDALLDDYNFSNNEHHLPDKSLKLVA